MKPKVVHKSLFNILDSSSRTPAYIIANEQNHILDAVFDMNFNKKIKYNEANRDVIIPRENAKLINLLETYLSSPYDRQEIIRKIRRMSCKKIEHYSKAVIVSDYIFKVGVSTESVQFCLILMTDKTAFKNWYSDNQKLVV